MNAAAGRERLVFAGLLFLLAALTVAAAIGGAAQPAAVPLDSSSNAPDGARALALWLAETGYQVGSEPGGSYQVPPDTALVFVLEPQGLDAEAFEILDAWAASGGTLIAAGESFASTALFAHFGVDRRYLSAGSEPRPPALPLFTAPPAAGPVPLHLEGYLEPGFPEYLPLAAVPEGPVAISFEHGDGRVILSVAIYPFTNAGLKEPGSAAFVLNLAGTVPAGSRVWFDEWHHGRRPASAEPGGPGAWLRQTPSGRAALFSVLAVFGWLALSGRAFGRPIPSHGEHTRRTALEYVTAIAGLNQRSGNRRELLDHYHARLKRQVGGRYRIDPSLPDQRFLAELAQYEPPAEIAGLAELLDGLRAPVASEAEMLRLCAEAARRLEK